MLRCLAYQFNFDYRVTMLLVLWALGWAMIVLAALVRLPASVVAAIGVVLIAGHNLLDSRDGRRIPLWTILHAPGFVLNTPEHVVFVAYPLIPWIGVTAVGYGLGQVYRWDADAAPRVPAALGLGLDAGVLVLRAINVYGDPSPWTAQPTALFTVLSFLNTTKYPPSLLFLLMTLGPALLFLRAVDDGTPRAAAAGAGVRQGAAVLLRAALRAASTCWPSSSATRATARRTGCSSRRTSRTIPFTAPPGWGYSLPVVYRVVDAVVVALYPLAGGSPASRQRRTEDWWLGYL